MADTIKIVDAGNGAGTDYTSLVTWESTQQKTISAGNREIALCRCTDGNPDTSSSGVHISGWTTVATGTILIWTDPSEGYRHNGIYPSSGDNKYRLETTSSWMNPIRIYEAYITIDGIPMKSTYSGTKTYAFDTDDASAFRKIYISSCMFTSADGRGIQFSANADSTLSEYYLWNNIVYDCGTFGVSLGDGDSTDMFYMYNNTVYNSGDDNFRTYTVSSVWKNNISQGVCNKSYDLFGGTITYSKNQGDESYNGINPITITDSVTFVSKALGDFNLNETDTIVMKTADDLSEDSIMPFNTDASGKRRPYGQWDFGALQYTSVNAYHMII